MRTAAAREFTAHSLTIGRARGYGRYLGFNVVGVIGHAWCMWLEVLIAAGGEGPRRWRT